MGIDRARPLLGTLVAIRVEGLADDAAHAAADAGFAAVADVHRLMSFHEAGSDISRLNREAHVGPVTIDPQTVEVLRAALQLAADSGGVFDVSIARHLVSWGFLPDPNASAIPDPDATWRDIEILDDERVRFHRPLWIDFGGIAKGYAVDRAILAMEAHGGAQYLVNAGGDLRISGPGSERVFLRVPMQEGDMVPAVDLTNGSLASSSGQEIAKRHDAQRVGPHVDGLRRASVGTRSFVSVLAPQCLWADALTKVVLARGTRAARVLKKHGATAYLYNARAGWRVVGMPEES